MPIYEYQCANQKCSHRFEVLQKVDEADPERCPECGQTGLARALNAPRFQLKGSGWYVSDFRNSDKPAPGKDSAEPTGENAESAKKAKPESGASNGAGAPAGSPDKKDGDSGSSQSAEAESARAPAGGQSGPRASPSA